jgi:ribosomal protein S18 acetylase RimI-like enzyme
LYEIIEARSKQEIDEIRSLFLEYANWLDFSLCFQGFDKELAELPGKYSPPDGRLYLAVSSGKYAGCIGMRKLEGSICEMKRLYVRPEFRGLGIGKLLIEKIIKDAKNTGYDKMRLDTIKEKMFNAVKLYEEQGFVEIDAYNDNPTPHTLYMELDL